MVIEFVNGDRVVFVDDRDYLIGQEDLEGVDYVLQANREGQHVPGNQDLADLSLVIQEALGVDPHQLGLPNRG